MNNRKKRSQACVASVIEKGFKKRGGIKSAFNSIFFVLVSARVFLSIILRKKSLLECLFPLSNFFIFFLSPPPCPLPCLLHLRRLPLLRPDRLLQRRWASNRVAATTIPSKMCSTPQHQRRCLWANLRQFRTLQCVSFHAGRRTVFGHTSSRQFGWSFDNGA